MHKKLVGIGDIGIYIPEPVISIEQILEERPGPDPKIQRAIRKAAEITGQKAIRFPRPWEDTATLAAQSAKHCLDRHTHLDYNAIRYITVGTETTVDHSKPVAAYVEGMLKKAGFPIPGSLSTFQVQHACAAGTLCLLSGSALLSHSTLETESGLVVCSDIARYNVETTAEVTQGSGAITLLVEQDADLVELDIETQGYSSQDVDDFFRPLGSVTAKVKGKYSIKCFEEALVEAFADHAKRKQQTPRDILLNTDFFVLHTPFKNMPPLAMRYLLDKYLSYTTEEADRFIEERGLLAAVEPASYIGNLYSGAMYLSLAALLKHKYREMGRDIIGKKIILASYGSGNIMIVLSGRIAQNAPRVIETWNFDHIPDSAARSGIEAYTRWTEMPEPKPGLYFAENPEEVPQGRFYLKSMREDGYREYDHRT